MREEVCMGKRTSIVPFHTVYCLRNKMLWLGSIREVLKALGQ